MRIYTQEARVEGRGGSILLRGHVKMRALLPDDLTAFFAKSGLGRPNPGRGPIWRPSRKEGSEEPN